MKFVSMSRRTWSTNEREWSKKYPKLMQEARELNRRFLSLCDLLVHDDGLVPSLRIDTEVVKQRKLKYIKKMNLDIVRGPNPRFRTPHVKFCIIKTL